MVVSINNFNYPHKSNPKLDNPTESTALQSFQSNLSESLHQLFSDPRHESSSFSLFWFLSCFKFLQGMNIAFAKLTKDLDYPVSKWKGILAEDYFSHTLNVLDALNLISSSISHLGNSRLTLSHALSLIPNSPSLALKHLKPIVPRKIDGRNWKEIRVGTFNCGKEEIIHQAMKKMSCVDLLILRVLLSGLYGGNENLDLLSFGELEGFDIEFGENLMIKEIEEINQAVKEVEDGLVLGKESIKNGVTNELQRELKELENLLEMVGKEVNGLFSEVLAKRNELIDCLKLTKSLEFGSNSSCI